MNTHPAGYHRRHTLKDITCGVVSIGFHPSSDVSLIAFILNLLRSGLTGLVRSIRVLLHGLGDTPINELNEGIIITAVNENLTDCFELGANSDLLSVGRHSINSFLAFSGSHPIILFSGELLYLSHLHIYCTILLVLCQEVFSNFFRMAILSFRLPLTHEPEATNLNFEARGVSFMSLSPWDNYYYTPFLGKSKMTKYTKCR